MTLILPSSYLKTIIKYQTSHNIQFTCMKVFTILILDAYHVKASFIAKAHYHDVLIDPLKDISEA